MLTKFAEWEEVLRDSVNLTVVVLAHNEERHLGRLLTCLKRMNCCIFIVDSFSLDSSVKLAQSFGAQVVQHHFVNYALQFQWALDNLPIASEWVMRLDADEMLTDELIEEIERRLPLLPSEVAGINLKRRHVFMGRWIRRGGRYPLTLLRIWRNGAAEIEQRWMDEHMVLRHGQTVTFEHDFYDNNLNDLAFFIAKHNKYATREAIDRLGQEYQLFTRDNAVTEGASGAQARFKRILKERIYNRLPFGVGPFSYFLWRYTFQFGFLDGREGLIYHFLQGFWYRFLVEARVLELRSAVAHLKAKEDIKAEMARFTGLSIE